MIVLLWLYTAFASSIALEDSTWRMLEPLEVDRGGYKIHLFRSRSDCLGGLSAADAEDPDLVERCVPWIDPARRRIHLAFEVRHRDNRVPMAIDADRLDVALGDARGTFQLRDGVQLTPHHDAGLRQLFILLVDRSSSMYRDWEGSDGEMHRPRIEDVVRALLSPGVLSTFFPDGMGVHTGVMLFTFQDEVRGVNGQPWTDVSILTSMEEYRAEVDALLYEPQGGFTHLYDAVGTVLDDVLVTHEHVRPFIELTQADPALIVITDGFNNTSGPQKCGENAPMLTRVLKTIDRVHTRPGRTGVQLFTVGIGPPYAPDFRPPPGRPGFVSERQLCGDKAFRRIDGDLEREGIDNPSLLYMARAGGGRDYVGEDPGKVAALIQQTGARLHEWFELELELDERQLKRFRQDMPLLLEVTRPRHLEARTTLVPHPWLDGPGARVTESGRLLSPSIRSAFAVLVTGLGMSFFVFVTWVGLYHARRALLKRATTVGGRRG